MNLFEEQDIEYPLTVTVKRPGTEFDEAGDYQETFETIEEGVRADIQLSLKVRSLSREDKSGHDDNALWVMYCKPANPIRAGDRITDGTRTFVVDAAGEWGSHTECVLRKV